MEVPGAEDWPLSFLLPFFVSPKKPRLTQYGHGSKPMVPFIRWMNIHKSHINFDVHIWVPRFWPMAISIPDFPLFKLAKTYSLNFFIPVSIPLTKNLPDTYTTTTTTSLTITLTTSMTTSITTVSTTSSTYLSSTTSNTQAGTALLMCGKGRIWKKPDFLTYRKLTLE